MEKECIEMIVGIIEIASAILVLIGASMGLSALNKWKEKQFNVTFSFYARLKTKLKIIYDMMVKPDYVKIVSEHMLPQILRVKDPGVFTPIEPVIIKRLSELSDETIEFLASEDNQVPISENWNEQLSELVVMLEDCASLKNDCYFKWIERNDDVMNEYFRRHTDNLTSIITDIEQCQTGLTKEYLKKIKGKTARRPTPSDT